jgi:archaellum component FlaC
MANEDIILEILKRIQPDVSDVRRRMESIEVRQSAMDDHMRGTMTSVIGIHADLQRLNGRVDRIERRLELVSV